MDELQEWVSQEIGVPVANQIIMTSLGKSLKQETFNDDGDIFVFDRALISPIQNLPTPKLESELTEEDATLWPMPPLLTRSSNYKDMCTAISRNYEWANSVLNRAQKVQYKIEEIIKRTTLLHRAISVSVINLDSHGESIGRVAQGILKACETRELLVSKLRRMPLLIRKTEGMDDTLYDKFSEYLIQDEDEETQVSINQIPKVVNECHILKLETETSSQSESSLAPYQESKINLDEIRGLVTRMKTDSDTVNSLSDRIGDSKAKRVAANHSRDYMPALQDAFMANVENYHLLLDINNEARESVLKKLRHLSSLQSEISQLSSKLKNLHMPTESNLGTVCNKIAIFGSELVSEYKACVKRSKLRIQFQTILDELLIQGMENLEPGATELKRQMGNEKEMVSMADVEKFCKEFGEIDLLKNVVSQMQRDVSSFSSVQNKDVVAGGDDIAYTINTEPDIEKLNAEKQKAVERNRHLESRVRNLETILARQHQRRILTPPLPFRSPSPAALKDSDAGQSPITSQSSSPKGALLRMGMPSTSPLSGNGLTRQNGSRVEDMNNNMVINTVIKELSDRIKTVERERTQLQEDLIAHQSNAEQESKTRNEEASHFIRIIEQQKEQLATFEVEKASGSERLMALESEIVELRDGIDQWRNRRTALQKEMNQLQNTYSQKVGSLENHIRELQESVVKEQNEVRQLKETVTAVQKEKEDMAQIKDDSERRHKQYLTDMEKILLESFSEGASFEDSKRAEELQLKLAAVAKNVGELKAEKETALSELRKELSRKFQHDLDQLQTQLDKKNGTLSSRTVKLRDLTQKLYTYHDRSRKILESIGLTFAHSETNPIKKLGDPEQEESPDLLYWTNSSDSDKEDEKYAEFMNGVAVDLDAFTETVLQRIADLERQSKRSHKESRAYRDRALRFAYESKRKISYRGFKEGDLALFLPTRNQKLRVWAAFNDQAPYHFLRETENHRLKSREFLVARITKIEEKLVQDDTAGAGAGTGTGTGDDDGGNRIGSSVHSNNPFDLAHGSKWYMLDAVEEKVKTKPKISASIQVPNTEALPQPSSTRHISASTGNI